MPTVVCIAGPQGSSTTELLRGLAAQLSGRGLKVGLISQEPEPCPPPAASHWEISLGRHGYRLCQPGWQPPSLAELLARHGRDLDLVLTTAHPEQKAYKIEYCPAGHEPTLLSDPNLKALIVDQPQAQALPCFTPQDLAGLAELLAGLVSQPARPQMRVLVDGRRLPAKDFVQDILASTIKAMIGTLKGGQDAKRIEIHLY